MASDRTDRDERQARLDEMVDEFRAAQQRRLVKRGILLWNRTEAAQQLLLWSELPPPGKVH
jgi:hypothetical protein